MPLSLTIEAPSDLPDELCAQMLAQEIEAAANINALWVLHQWRIGNKPPCCAKCANVAYVPQPPQIDSWSISTEPVVLQRNVASCESVAAMHTGHKRAEEIKRLLDEGVDEREAWRRAKAKYQIKLEDTDRPRYWHVVSIDDGVRIDGTKGMR